MFMVLCKNNCLTDFLTIINFKTISHKNMKHLLHGIFIKYPCIQSRRINSLRQFTVFRFKRLFIGSLVLF